MMSLDGLFHLKSLEIYVLLSITMFDEFMNSSQNISAKVSIIDKPVT